jgi:hypothetical protein
VPANNAGTTRLRKAWVPEVLTEGVRTKATAAANTPEANAEKAAWRKGRPIHPNALAAPERARGRPASAEARRKMSEAYKQRGTRPPAAGPAWTPGEDALLGTMPDKQIARRTGRTLLAVRSRGYGLRVEKFGPRGERSRPTRTIWPP